MTRKLYLYNQNDEVKNIFVTEVEAGPHDIIDNSTEKPPLPEVEGFYVVFDLTKDSWIYRINLRKKFYDPTNGQVIDNELNPEFAKHTLEDFGVKSVDELVTTPPPETPKGEVEEINKSYYWSYEESKWMLNLEKYKESALERLKNECGTKISDLTKGIPDDEIKTYTIQYEEAIKYKNATPEEKDTEVEIKVLIDFNILLFGIMHQTYGALNDFDFVCPHCNERFQRKIITDTLIKNTSESIGERIEDITAASDKTIPFKNSLLRKFNKRLRIPETDFIIDIRLSNLNKDKKMMGHFSKLSDKEKDTRKFYLTMLISKLYLPQYSEDSKVIGYVEITTPTEIYKFLDSVKSKSYNKILPKINKILKKVM